MLKQFSTGGRKMSGSKSVTPGPEAASEIAVSAFAFLAQDPETTGQFLNQAGLDPQDLRAASGTPEFLAAVLEFICSSEPQLMAFAANAGMDPETVDQARKVLAGPEGEWSA